MESNQTMPILFPFDPNEFWKEMRLIIREEVSRTNAEQPSYEEPLIKRKDMAKKLEISLVTLNDWVKRGLPAHKQRGKVYFLYSEVVKYIRKNNLRKALL